MLGRCVEKRCTARDLSLVTGPSNPLVIPAILIIFILFFEPRRTFKWITDFEVLENTVQRGVAPLVMAGETPLETEGSRHTVSARETH